MNVLGFGLEGQKWEDIIVEFLDDSLGKWVCLGDGGQFQSHKQVIANMEDILLLLNGNDRCFASLFLLSILPLQASCMNNEIKSLYSQFILGIILDSPALQPVHIEWIVCLIKFSVFQIGFFTKVFT